jgi:thiol-disulfide isomerase/thioredoxin
LDKKNLHLPSGKNLTDYIQKIKKVEFERNFSQFEVIDYNGNEFKLPPKNNKIILFDFWASWCKPCIEDISKLKILYNKYDKNILEIYSISIDEDVDSWKNASIKNKIIWNNFLALEKTDSFNLRKNYPLYHIPQNLILLNGVVLERNLRGISLDNYIDSLCTNYSLGRKF